MLKSFVLTIICIVITVIPICIAAQFGYLSVWGNHADFKAYEAEFVLVKDYILENVPQEKSLYLSNNADHYFDLYDFETKQYLNCPETIRDALKIVSINASRSQETQFNLVTYKDNKIIFGVETVPYAIVYSPNEIPYDVLGNYPKKDVHCKRIKDGWYHITIHSF